MKAQPQWWKEFARTVNSFVADFIGFFIGLTAYQILHMVFGIWFIAMIYWVKNFLQKLTVLYLVFIVAYFFVGFYYLY